MIIDIEGKPKDRLIDKIYKKFISTSDSIGYSVYDIYDNRDKLKETISQKIKPNQDDKTKKKSYSINIFDIIKSLFKSSSTKKIDKKRKTGLIIVSSTIIAIGIFILYILNVIITAILEIMEWWVLAILVVLFTVPIAFAVAFYVASGDY